MRYDVAVVGAGPAGAVVAGLLARRGRSVLLVDRSEFPRPKVCGCCLNRRALAALADAGLGDVPERLGAVPTERILLASGRRSCGLPLDGVSVSRSAFDHALAEAAIVRGAVFRPGWVATLGPEEADKRTLILRKGRDEDRIDAGLVIAADGLGGQLAGGPAPVEEGSRIGAGVVLDAPPFYAPGTIYMTCGPGGYAGLVRLEDGRLDVACALDREATRRHGGPAPVTAALLRHAGWPVPPALLDAPWRGTPPLTRRARRVAAHRLLVVGDAAGYVEPFTGEGMAWAISSALALAPIAARPWDDRLPMVWARRHRLVTTQRQFVCRALAAVLRRPWLTGGLVAMLQLCPALAWPVLRSLDRPAVEAR